VKSDLERTLALPHVHTIILDDYGTRTGVKQAVTDVVASGAARIRRFVGHAPGWSHVGSVVPEWEGVVLDAVRDGKELGESGKAVPLARALIDSSWVIFPQGVFNTGYFSPDGNIQFHDRTATSSYGPMEWRQSMPGETDEGFEDDSLVLQVTEEPYWRLQVRLNKYRTGMVLARNDDQVFVAVRAEMMRLIGDKMISFLH